MSRTMGDSTDLAGIPATVAVVATYINGHVGVSTPEQLEARFPHARYGHVWIDVDGSRADRADVLDVEPGDAGPGTANLWVQSWHALKRPGLPVLYVNRSEIDAVVAACLSGGMRLIHEYGLWVATLDGTQYEGAGVVACQVTDHGTWDESVVYDASIWLPVAPPKPRITPQQAHDAIVKIEGGMAQIAAATATLAEYVAQG